MSSDLYRILAFRYIFIISFGCYLFICQKNEKKRKTIISYLLGILGLLYIVVFNYTDRNPIITGLWTNTSVFAVLFIVPIMIKLVNPNGIHNKFFELCGRASFNIFLTQMIFYWLFAKYIYEYLPTFMQLPANIIICVTLGILFYLVEDPITSRIIAKIKGKSITPKT